MDSYIGKLRAIVHAIGHDGEWYRRLGLGNPAADKSVKDYLRLVTAEQFAGQNNTETGYPLFRGQTCPVS